MADHAANNSENVIDSSAGKSAAGNDLANAQELTMQSIKQANLVIKKNKQMMAEDKINDEALGSPVKNKSVKEKSANQSMN